MTYKSTGGWAKGAAVVFCIVFTWLSLFAYSEHIWNTMDRYAQTDAEWSDVTSDTGRSFGPFLVGAPFAVLYTFIWLGCCSVIGKAIRFIHLRHTDPKQPQFHQSYSDYRESLVREYTTNKSEPPTV